MGQVETSDGATAIIVDNELYEFNVLPQVLKTSPAAFSRVMAQNFAENMYRDVLSIRNLVGHNETFLTTDSGPWFKRNFKKFEPGYLSGSILHRDIRTFCCFTYFFFIDYKM